MSFANSLVGANLFALIADAVARKSPLVLYVALEGYGTFTVSTLNGIHIYIYICMNKCGYLCST